MSEALEAACNNLSAAAKPEVAPEVAAGRIIAAAKSGERDPVRLRAAALAHNESD
jgi:starvation-inducible outer membrane lipoprotein